MPVIFRGAPNDESKKQRLNEALGFFESMLKGRTWAAINNFTIADLTLTVTVAQIEMIGIDLEPYTRVRTWLQRCKDHLSQYGYDVSEICQILWFSSFVSSCSPILFYFCRISNKVELNWPLYFNRNSIQKNEMKQKSVSRLKKIL